jgi:3' terminal RNA ribose 2'-O-methyltransferase Hen1
MMLKISTTRVPATDLGYLLHKNPSRIQSFDLSFGRVHVFYPQAAPGRCEAALLLDIDPVGLSRGGRNSDRAPLEPYVNDRPYVASSFLSVAIAQVLASALAGRCKELPGLAEERLPLTAEVTALPCRGGESLLRKLFEPMGYVVSARGHVLDEERPEWGPSPYFSLSLSATTRLKDLLTHLYVLIPVLDDRKHYFVGSDEVEKLIRRGRGWLETHPERELVAQRYLVHVKSLVRQALSRLTEEGEEEAEVDAQEEDLERKLNLNDQRIGAVLAALKSCGARRVLDLGCGEGRLMAAMLREKSFEEIVGVDVSCRALEAARNRLRWERLPPRQRERLKLIHGSLTYRDKRLSGYEAATVVEVIEHLDPARLAAFERVLFEFARPGTVILTTPNSEYNVRFENLGPGKLRHKDHRFEWTRGEFQAWAASVSGRFGYTFASLAVGPEDPEVGPPTQMGMFRR